jgi:hypothetical protein
MLRCEDLHHVFLKDGTEFENKTRIASSEILTQNIRKPMQRKSAMSVE